MAGPEQATAPPRPARLAVGVVAAIVALAALKLGAALMLPLALALFLVATFSPLQRRLERRLPRWLSVALVFLVFLVTMAVLVGALWLTVVLIERRLPAYVGLFSQRVAEVRRWATAAGLLPPEIPVNVQGIVGFVRDAAVQLTEWFVSFGGAFGLTVAFFFFGVVELGGLERRMRRALPGRDPAAVLRVVDAIGTDLLRYMVVRTGIGLLTGILVGLATFAFGVELWVVWGLLAFLLNYVPILGSVIAVVPPVLFSAVESNALGPAALLLAVLVGIQLVVGSYLDPMIQGRYLSLSPLVVLLSITVWGFVWGVVGAFVGVPITVGIAVACHQFERTRWVAALLGDLPAGPPRGLPADGV